MIFEFDEKQSLKKTIFEFEKFMLVYAQKKYGTRDRIALWSGFNIKTIGNKFKAHGLRMMDDGKSPYNFELEEMRRIESWLPETLKQCEKTSYYLLADNKMRRMIKEYYALRNVSGLETSEE